MIIRPPLKATVEYAPLTCLADWYEVVWQVYRQFPCPLISRLKSMTTDWLFHKRVRTALIPIINELAKYR